MPPVSLSPGTASKEYWRKLATLGSEKPLAGLEPAICVKTPSPLAIASESEYTKDPTPRVEDSYRNDGIEN